jgi:hypothetical protein
MILSEGLEIHDYGNLWYSFSLPRFWRDTHSKGWIPFGYSATHHNEDGGWIRLTVKQDRGHPLYHFLTHEGDELETTGEDAAQGFVFMRQAAGIDDTNAPTRWKRCFGLPREDVDERAFCARQKMVEDTCLVVNGFPDILISQHPKMLWLNPKPVDTVVAEHLPVYTRTRHKRMKK